MSHKDKKKKQDKRLLNASRALQRKVAVMQGFYDGRFRHKEVPDRKKEENRSRARKRVDLRKEQ